MPSLLYNSLTIDDAAPATVADSPGAAAALS